MAKQKFPIQWILAFALTPVVIIVFVLFLLFGGGGERVPKKSQEQVELAIRHFPQLRPKYKQAMSDGKLTVNEANSIVMQANALRKKGKK